MAKLDELYQLQSELAQEAKNLAQSVTDQLVAEWKAAGGCETCLGHKSVVTWSTLDGPGWTEYGPCSACTPESDKAGKMPGSFWAGGYSAARSSPLNLTQLFNLPQFHTEAVLLNTYQLHLEALAAEIKNEQERLTVGRGKKVVVVRGRKIPKGTTGECFWVGTTHSQYGAQERAGFTTEQGETVWIAKSHLEVVV